MYRRARAKTRGWTSFWARQSGTCEKANRGARTCAVYPDGIPWEYRRKVKGRPDERDTTPDCPEYQQETDPQRWMTPEWRQIMQELEREVERDRERGK